MVTKLGLPGGRNRMVWDGLVGRQAAPARDLPRPGPVRDTAGNVGVTPAEFAVGAIPGRPGLTVRGLAAQPPLRPVTAGQRVEFGVDARGARVPLARAPRGRLGGAQARLGDRRRCSPSARPTGPSGVYLLELRSGRWHTTVPFLVQAEKRSSVLVVVPAITWLGTDKVDDRPFDGLPNTLADGGTVRWPRAFVGTDGLPAGWSEIAPLLVFLDRQRIRYDLTSDLDLDLTRNPRASDRAGRAVRRLRALDHAHAGQAAAQLRQRRRPRRAVRRRLDAPRRAPARLHRRRGRARSRARRSRRPPTRSGRGSASRGRCRRPPTLSQFEGDPQYGLMEGAQRPAGLQGARGGLARDRQGATWRRSGSR